MQIKGYQSIEILSRNKTTAVFRGRRARDNLSVLIKLADSHDSAPVEARLAREFDTCGRVGKSTLPVPLEQEQSDRGRMFVYRDPGGELLDRILSKRTPPLVFSLHLSMNLCQLIRDIHEADMVGKHIQPGTLLLHTHNNLPRLHFIGLDRALFFTRERVTGVSMEDYGDTLAYISPEQTGRIDRILDYRTDFFSLGALMYRLFTGKLPFPSKDPMDIIHGILAAIPPPPRGRLSHNPVKNHHAALIQTTR